MLAHIVFLLTLLSIASLSLLCGIKKITATSTVEQERCLYMWGFEMKNSVEKSGDEKIGGKLEVKERVRKR